VDDETFNVALRPRTLAECIGSGDLMEKLHIAISAAKNRAEPMEHVLLHGPPGLGKTTLAYVIAHEMASTIKVTSGPALTRPSDLIGILTNLENCDVLFIDEIHRLSPAVEEYIYPAMEEYKVDFVVDSGMHSRTINLPLKPFTLIGATTRAGMLSPPLRTRFGITHHLEFWCQEDLVRRLRMSAGMLKIDFDEPALLTMAARARGTPRIANRLLRRCRDFAQVKADGRLTMAVVNSALKLEGIDQLGLDELDRNFLRIIIDIYRGGPVGIEAVAATLGEETDTLVDVVEPFLLQIGFLARTRRGRLATDRAYQHLGLKLDRPADQSGLFDNDAEG
jgi:Holliday junction DNA helicase RuvB